MRHSLKPLGVVAALAALVVTGPLAAPGDATFPGSNGVVVFVENHGGCLDLFSVQPAGTGRTKLTQCPRVAADPTVSPDGRRVAAAYLSGNGWPHLVTLPIAGGSLTAVATGGVNRAADPSYDRTGAVLAFGGGGSDPGITRDIYSVPAGGGTPTKLTTTTGSDGNEEPEFSPTADVIAWAHRTGGMDGSYDVWTMTVDAQGRHPAALTDLTNGQGSSRWPSWSPDGSRLAFASDRSGTWQIYVMDADGTDPVQVTSGAAPHIQPSWSPDGGAIVFTRGCTHDDCAADDPRAEALDGNLLTVDVTDPTHPGAPTAVAATGHPEYDAQWARACTAKACAAAVTVHRRARLASLHRLVAKGRVTVPDGPRKCRRRVPVVLQYENNLNRGSEWKPRAPWLTEDRTRTSRAGRFRLHLPAHLTGWYRVRATPLKRGSTTCAAAASPTKVNNTIRDRRGEARGPVDIRWAWVTFRHGVITHTIRTVRPFSTGQLGTPCILFNGGFTRSNKPNGAIGCFGGLLVGDVHKPLTTRRPDSRTISYSFPAKRIDGRWKDYIWTAWSRGTSDCDLYDMAPDLRPICGQPTPYPPTSALFTKHEPT